MKGLYFLSGPALSLYTHMSYILFALQNLLLLPWILFGAASSKLMWPCLIGFVVTWLGIGWYMHDLF